jgi:hypothetical protein
MSECDFYIHGVVDDVAVSFYVGASSHTEASNKAMCEAQRRRDSSRRETPIFQFHLKPTDSSAARSLGDCSDNTSQTKPPKPPWTLCSSTVIIVLNPTSEVVRQVVEREELRFSMA